MFAIVLALGSINLRAQSGYDIKINFKDCPDSTVFLARYYWDQYPIVDSSKGIRNGKIRFSGKEHLPEGVYFIANQQKDNFYFQFIVGKDQKINISCDHADIIGTQKADDPLNREFFSYVKFMTDRNRDLERERQKQAGKKDSAEAVTRVGKQLNEQTLKFDADFMKRNKGNFVYDLMNLKAEHQAANVPLASNGRPDSIYQYYYYRNHFFDGVNFRDARLLYTPFLAGKVKRYFDQLLPQVPDSVIAEIDGILGKTEPRSEMYRVLVGYLAHKYETNKTMVFDREGRAQSFEKVFVHIADKYILGGKMKGYYSDETEKLIADRVNIVRHLLPDAHVPDLYVIDTLNGRRVLNMGFDTAATSAGATYLYNKNLPALQPMFRTLYSIPAKYTVLVFWAADCDHCRKEVPKLHDNLQKLNGKVDYKVLAVQTKHDLYDSWKKFIVEKNLTGFIHGFDPVHLNNLKEQFDIDATPAIYLLDREKRIKGKKLSSDQVVEIIENLERLEKNSNK